LAVTIPNLPNFLPNLSTLREQIEPMGSADPERFRTTYFQLELLPYCLGAAYQALLDFVEAEVELAEASPPRIEEGRPVLQVIGPAGWHRLSYRIDAFLESARRTQNALIPYIGKVHKVSLPSSMADVVKRLESKVDLLPEAIRTDISAYWARDGARLKAYRDISQHHALVATEVRLFLSSQGKPAIYMALPNNPDEKNPTKLVFTNPPVIAFNFMRNQLHALIRFCHAITTRLTVPPEGELRTAVSAVVFRDPAVLGDGSPPQFGHHLITPDDVRMEIAQLVAGWRPL
jgi:hypothetical protein